MTTQAELLAQRLRFLDIAQWRSRAEIEGHQRQALASLARHCETYSPQFRKRLQAAGLRPEDLGAPGGLQRLPVLSRREVQAAHDLFCTAVPKAHMPRTKTQTSGSTGEPVLIWRTALNRFDWLCMTMREHLWHERAFSEPFCAIRANIDEVRLNNWGAPAALLRETGPLLGLPINRSIAEQVEKIAAFHTHTLLIYPNALSGVIDYCQSCGVRLADLKAIITVGEALSPDIRARAEAFFDVKISDIYSSQEAGTIALQCPVSGLYHTMAENVIVEVVDSDGKAAGEGNSGRLLITDLRNFATPLVRYDIGDYAKMGPPCPCGRGLPTLSHVLGRERNLIVMPDGSRNWPMMGYAKYRQIAPIVQYQIVQEDREHVEMRLVVERPLTAEEESGLTAHVQKSLGHPFQIRLSYFDGKIPASPTGKFEEFVCRAH
jgi:phenylacetate-CoA ligase